MFPSDESVGQWYDDLEQLLKEEPISDNLALLDLNSTFGICYISRFVL